ncbi:CPBP family intramembrane metalloprotease [Halobellus sp. Atlit-38R]|uniref:CPBP family intramembrane glutamic endopeptidase n=1 Tax=Halobellus sp. Atlit-38R TaxID=2282131 RepID=UPI000EF19518|nr:CPBP family intramembrane glutamic endopeptidase [Halobellus sp. Atlit-38R]RLM84262.1 CPBP family intramembrane metalloprotease [Halobellus sp. Atlit-38R]
MTSTHAHDEPTAEEVHTARRGLLLYFGVVLLGSVPLLYLIISAGAPIEQQLEYILALMWTPAIASIVARVGNGEGFDDLSFRLRDREVAVRVLQAILFPFVVGAIAYGAAWGLGLAEFSAPVGTSDPLSAFAGELLFAATIGAVVGVISAAGEEIGWRGYMASRLVTAGVPAPVLTGGVLWGCWHVPAILTGQYAAGPSRVLSAILFVVVAVSVTVLWSAWTFETGSIWPAILGHSAWNAVIQGPFDTFSSGELATTWVGESGLFVVAATIVVVAVLVSDRFANRVGSKREPFP